MKSNVTPQVIQETINTATRPSLQGLAPPQDETNKKFEDLATQVRNLKRRLETFEKGATSTKIVSAPARPQVSLTTAEGYLAWLQQLDLRTPEGITDWKKAEVGVAGQCLVKFGNLDLILVTQGGLHEPFELNEDARDSSPVKEEPGLVQELCHAGCVELTLTTGGHLAAEIPKYLLQLGSVYRKPKSRDTLSPPVMAARLYMDITKPSKSLWLVRLGLGGSTTMSFSRTFDLGDDGSVTFDVAKLVDDISTLDTSDISDPILADQEHVARTLKKSAHLIVTSFQNAKLIKPKPYELEHAIRTGWAENYGA
ncbi:hypothetical protein PG985_016089 [Apiospora marii]|uniref:Uncharacterized protein n=1 Tax=Apiospora marii TaxID=335849 RepID=A0ABR1S3Q7_9PEZI